MNVQTQPDLTEFEFALFAAILSAHQNRERIVACARAGGRVECPQAVGRVSAGLLVPDRRCAEDWESPRARACQRAVFFPNPFFAPQLNTESEPNCHLAPSRIPRSMIAVDENLCVYSPSGEPWDIVCDVSTVRLMLGSSRSCRICRSRHSRLGRVSGFLLSPGADCACNGVVRHVWRSTFRRRQSESRVREDRSNRRVILVFALIGLLNGYICQPTRTARSSGPSTGTRFAGWA
jgi:hypothetical protein